MATLQKINFVDPDPDAVVSSLVSYYQSLTGKILQPGQIEQLEFNAVAYRIALMLNAINETANQSLVAFATGAALEQLGLLMGVFRLPAAAAECTIRFNLVSGHTDLTIESGLRVQSVDGQRVFITTEEKPATTGDTYVDVKAKCIQIGVAGNGYVANRLIILLDPRPYVSSVTNINTTAGGTDNESDEAMRERILLAPSQFSVAGPTGAYKYWAKTAHPSIVDVAVTIGHDPADDSVIIPGQIDIYPLLLNNASLTTPIEDAIMAACNDEKIRPLTDTVVVKSPTQVDYSIAANLTILPTGNSTDIIAEVTTLLNAYIEARKNKLGIDAVRTQIIALCQANNVYSVTLASPVADVVVDERSFTNCTGITVNVVGTHDE